VTSTAEAYCWGRNHQGQLGVGSPGSTPQLDNPGLVGGGHAWTSVNAVGTSHSCGVTTAAEAYCWGMNIFGQLGDGTTTQRNTPVLVSGGHPWASVDGSSYTNCGVTSTAEAYCWGSNEYGQLGDGTTTHRSTPVLVSGGHTWASINSGYSYTCGLTTSGLAYCWGKGDEGELGEGAFTNRSTPTLVSGGHTWASISAGDTRACGVTIASQVYCWGDNRYGQLGDGTTTDRILPARVLRAWLVERPGVLSDPNRCRNLCLSSLSHPLILIPTRPLGLWLARYGGRVPHRSTETLEPHFDGTGWDADQGFGSLARH